MRALGACTKEPNLFIVTEFLFGGDLNRLIVDKTKEVRCFSAVLDACACFASRLFFRCGHRSGALSLPLVRPLCFRCVAVMGSSVAHRSRHCEGHVVSACKQNRAPRLEGCEQVIFLAELRLQLGCLLHVAVAASSHVQATYLFHVVFRPHFFFVAAQSNNILMDESGHIKVRLRRSVCVTALCCASPSRHAVLTRRCAYILQVADFGLSKVVGAGRRKLSTTQAGNWAYMGMMVMVGAISFTAWFLGIFFSVRVCG